MLERTPLFLSSGECVSVSLLDLATPPVTSLLEATERKMEEEMVVMLEMVEICHPVVVLSSPPLSPFDLGNMHTHRHTSHPFLSSHLNINISRFESFVI